MTKKIILGTIVGLAIASLIMGNNFVSSNMTVEADHGVDYQAACLSGFVIDPITEDCIPPEDCPNGVTNLLNAGSSETTSPHCAAEIEILFVDTETINLQGKLRVGDFVLLTDITPFESVTGHVAMKIPCGPNGEQLLEVVAGVAPNVAPITMDYVAPLSNPPTSCLYHGDLDAGITDVALINLGDNPVRFHQNPGYTVVVTIAGK